jgi:hypothetical protein
MPTGTWQHHPLFLPDVGVVSSDEDSGQVEDAAMRGYARDRIGHAQASQPVRMAKRYRARADGLVVSTVGTVAIWQEAVARACGSWTSQPWQSS